MYKKHIIILFIILASIGLTFFTLYETSPLSEEIHPSSFIRNFADAPVARLAGSVDMGEGLYYIAGISQGKIWIGDHRKPLTLKGVTPKPDLTGDSQISLLGIDSISDPAKFQLLIDSPYFYVFNGLMPIILRGETGVWQARPIIDSLNAFFIDALPLTDSTIALKSYSMASGGVQIGILRTSKSPSFKFNNNLLKKQRDGFFSVDGKMHFSDRFKKLVHIYTFRNEYTVTSNDLSTVYTGNTIDTFKTALIKVRKLKNSETSLLSSPPYIVNGASCVNDTLLYIKSNLLARNEDKEEFINSSTIDVYDIKNTKYLTSIRIPNFKQISLSEFRINNNKAYCLFKNYLLVYDLK